WIATRRATPFSFSSTTIHPSLTPAALAALVTSSTLLLGMLFLYVGSRTSPPLLDRAGRRDTPFSHQAAPATRDVRHWQHGQGRIQKACSGCSDLPAIRARITSLRSSRF